MLHQTGCRICCAVAHHPGLQMFQAWFPCSGDPAATRFPPKPCLASMRQSEQIEASIGQQQPTPTPQSCRMFAKHGFHSSQPQNPRGNSPQQLNTMLSKLAALREQKRHHQPTQASKVLSMVSSFRKNQLLGIHHNRKTKPCLANMLPEVRKGAARAPRRATDPLSMVFIPASHKPPGKTSHINQTPCLEPLKPHNSRNQH